MKRIFLILCTLALVVACAVPAFAATISPEDYIVSESSNGDTSTLYVSVPSGNLSVLFNLLNGETYATISSSSEKQFTITMDSTVSNYWVGCQVFDKLDVSNIVDGSTLNVKFNISQHLGPFVQPSVGSVRYQVRYYDASGTMLDGVKFYTVPDANFFTDTGLDITISKPDGAVAMSFIVQFMNITSDQLPITYTLGLESVNFICDIPTMVRVQQETGRTNQLLEDFMHGYEPDAEKPVGSDIVDDVNQGEKDVLDKVQNGEEATEDLFLTFIDKLMLYTAGFGVFSSIFEMFTRLGFVDVLLTVSLALGLFSLLFGAVMQVVKSKE